MPKAQFFLVAESRAFFEASRHVLRSLQVAEVDTMPFTRYLVSNKPIPMNPPIHLDTNTAIYNLRSLYKDQTESIQLSFKSHLSQHT